MTSLWIFWIRPEGCSRLNAVKYETKLKQIQKFFPKSLDPIFTVRWHDKEKNVDTDGGDPNIMATFTCQPLNGETEVTQMWSLYRSPSTVPRSSAEFRLDTTKCARAFVEFSLQIQEMVVSSFSHTFGLYLDEILSSQNFYISAARVLSKVPPLKIDYDKNDGDTSNSNKNGPTCNRDNGSNVATDNTSPEWSDTEIDALLNLIEAEMFDIKNLAEKAQYLSQLMNNLKYDRSPYHIKHKVKKLRKRYRRDVASGRPSIWNFFPIIDRLMKQSPSKDEDDEDKDGDSDSKNEEKVDQNDHRERWRPAGRRPVRDRRRRASPVERGVWSYEETRSLLHVVEDSGYDLLNVTSSQCEIMSRVLKRRYGLDRFTDSVRTEVDKLLTTYRREARGTRSRWRLFPEVDRLVRRSPEFDILAKNFGITDSITAIPKLLVNFDAKPKSLPSLMNIAVHPIPPLIIKPTAAPAVQLLPATGAIGSPVHTAKRELLRVDGPIPIAWISATGGNYPNHHVESDRYGAIVTLVARAEFEGVELPAQLQTDGNGRGACYIYWGTMIQEVYSYEVLVSPPGVFTWVTSANGEFVGDAIIGGRSRTGEALFIGRCSDNLGRKIPGIILPSRGLCFILLEGKQIGMPEYEILVVAS